MSSSGNRADNHQPHIQSSDSSSDSALLQPASKIRCTNNYEKRRSPHSLLPNHQQHYISNLLKHLTLSRQISDPPSPYQHREDTQQIELWVSTNHEKREIRADVLPSEEMLF
ncbi:hypothetical protein ACET3Z_010928 [Daucus carota]